MKYSLFTTLLLCAFLVMPAWSQDGVTYTVQDESTLWVDGTSNKSDWTVKAKEIAGTITMNETVTSADPGVSSVAFSVVSKQVVSEKSSIMDRLMHKALQVTTHTEIVYTLTEATVSSSDGDAFTLLTQGELTIAGQAKNIEMTVEGLIQSDGSVRFTGTHTMLMSDFGIKPPTAMYGALRTGDEVTVQFDVVAAR